MALQYQYQYQYQYQMQYQSFYQMLQDVPYKIPLISLIVAISPFILYYLFKKSSVSKILSYPLGLFSFIKNYIANKKLKKRIEYEYNYLIRKKESPAKRIMPLISFLITILFTFLIIKQVLFLGLVVSGSMMPTLMPADLVMFEALTLNSLNDGDIVTFINPYTKNQVVHRLISINKGKYKTQGDNSNNIDDWILKREDIIGKAVWFNGRPVVVKKLGWYFMPIRGTYIPGTSKGYEITKEMFQFIHEQGPIIITVILLLIVVLNFENKKKYNYEIYE